MSKKSKKKVTRKEERQKGEAERWLDYLTEGMDEEPKTQQEMVGQGFRSVGRTMLFMGWLYWKTIGLMFKAIRGVYRMFRKKKKEKEEQNNPAMDELLRMGQQFQQPAQQQPPIPPAPAPPVGSAQDYAGSTSGSPQAQPQPAQPQSVQPQVAPPVNIQPQFQPQAQLQPVQPVQPEVKTVKNPLNVIIEALKNLKLKMDDIEADIDNIYQRLNMLQGVQSIPERRIKFR